MQGRGLVIADLEGAVGFYYSQGLAESNRRTYDVGMRRFYRFCDAYNISTPFPVSESTLCYFVTVLANDNSAAQTIKTYLATVRDTNIALGFLVPCTHAAMPRLDRIQAVIYHVLASRGKKKATPTAPDPGNPQTHEATLDLGQRRELATELGDVRPLLLWIFRLGKLLLPRGTEQGSDELGGTSRLTTRPSPRS